MSENASTPSNFPPPAPRKPLLAAAIERPGRAVAVAMAIARGHWHRLYYRLRGVRFRAGRNLRLFAALSVHGPGEVILGDDVVVLDKPTFTTHSREARIVVGDRTVLGAASFGCAKEIRIGHHCIVARASFLDTDFHSARADRWMDDAPVRVSPVEIGNNVWIAQHAAILPGTKIGDNSVVSFGAVVMRSFPENVIIVGNPAKVAAPVQQRPAPAPPSCCSDGGVAGEPAAHRSGDAFAAPPFGGSEGASVLVQ